MKKVAKVLGAVLLAGAATLAVSQPAAAAVSVGVGIGPGYYGPGPGYNCDPYSRFYNPYYCGGGYPYYGGYGPYYGPYWGGPSVVIGGRFGGGFHGGGRGHR